MSLEMEISQSSRALLVVVVDMTPAWWGLCGTEEFSLTHCMEAVLGLANLHLIFSPLNELAIYGVTPENTELLYPHDAVHAESFADETHNGQYDLLGVMNTIVRRKSSDMIRCSTSISTKAILASAVLKALCYYVRRCRELCPTQREDPDCTHSEANTEFQETTKRISARMLIIKAADENPCQYLSLMNAIFTAQKLQVPIDTCILPLCPPSEGSLRRALEGNFDSQKQIRHSGLFQQASDLTGGIYLEVPRLRGLLQYLISVFLPPAFLRNKLLLPDMRSGSSSSGVDFRAACFCHRRLIDMGFVCSICLSVFCEFSPICETCGSAFVVPPVQNQ